MSQNKSNRFAPLWMAICVIIGIFVGTFYTNHFSGNRLNIINLSGNKLNNLLHIIDDQYVDTVNMNELVEKAMPQILSELDPHSVYIGVKDVQAANDDLRGSFSGIGIEFVIRQDTIRVQNVIGNGPAERAGLLAGDKIVEVDDSVFVGKKVTNEEAMHRLKGPKDTQVKLGVIRYGEKKIQHITVTRGEIPTKSITACYMLDDESGYMKIKNFGDNTYPELLIALATLAQNGFSSLVIDLRGNTGGYLESAVQIANEFLSKGQLIVYTEGRRYPRQDYRADGRGSYQRIPLVILVDEGSASASEILAGAIQDNDRGTIIGRRSFGKGLVQKPMEFSDHSMIRLTIARYYSPSGRCIQKPYENGKNYEDDWVSRYQHGEFFSVDSIKHIGPEYHTAMGRVVYGGGGITPDIFVPEDTLNMTSYYKEAAMTGLVLQFAYNYTDENRKQLSEIKTVKELENHLKRQHIVEKFVVFADKNGLKRRNLMIQKSYKLLETFICSRIIYNIQNEQALMEYLNQDDPVIIETLRLFKNGEAFPKLPQKVEPGQKVAYDYRTTDSREVLLTHA